MFGEPDGRLDRSEQTRHYVRPIGKLKVRFTQETEEGQKLLLCRAVQTAQSFQVLVHICQEVSRRHKIKCTMLTLYVSSCECGTTLCQLYSCCLVLLPLLVFLLPLLPVLFDVCLFLSLLLLGPLLLLELRMNNDVGDDDSDEYDSFECSDRFYADDDDDDDGHSRHRCHLPGGDDGRRRHCRPHP